MPPNKPQRINRIGNSNTSANMPPPMTKSNVLGVAEINSLLNENVGVDKRNDFYRWDTGYPNNYILDSYLNFINIECRPRYAYKHGHPLNNAFGYAGQSKIKFNYDKTFHKKVLCLYSEIERLKKSVINTKDFFEDTELDYQDTVSESLLFASLNKHMKSIVNGTSVFSGAEMALIHEAIRKFKDDGEIISIMEESDNLYADVCKLREKYSIRLADSKYAVASDKVTVTLRDPSETPSWITWFLNAVPLEKTPDMAKILTLPEDERAQYYPQPLNDSPIICHATLWKLGQESGVLFSTSWNHISVNYRWKIKKPIEIAAMLFRTVSHPAHLARNFSAAPQISLPGNEWF